MTQLPTDETSRGGVPSAPGAPASPTPVFDALLAEARQARAADLVSSEEVGRRRPLSEEDRAIAAEYLAALDRLEGAQDAEVTPEQARLLGVVQLAARALRGGRSLAEWAAYSGYSEDELRAAAVALEALGFGA
jgi:hypothetical protein